MRILLTSFLGLLVLFLYLQGRVSQPNSEKPVFLKVDKIAQEHQTVIDITIQSAFKPSEEQIHQLKKNYSNLWAHLNHLYATNDFIAGKEYYTEEWFNHLAHQSEDTVEPTIRRKDLYHDLHIQNWSDDGLVCTAIDKNVLLEYSRQNQTFRTTTVDIAVALLFQGDHWRIVGMDVIREIPPSISR